MLQDLSYHEMENCQKAFMDSHDKLEDIGGHIGHSVDTPADLEQFREIIAATGTRSVAIHRDANGAFIITGDNNVITLNIPSQGDRFQAGDVLYPHGAEVLRSLLWQKGSRTLLAEQLQQLTTNPLTQGQGISYQVEDVYVPLGLLERKKQPIQRQDITPEQESDSGRKMGINLSSGKTDDVVTEDDRETQVEITKRFEHDEFLNEVFLQGQSPKSQGKRIAIIGEPGAGKTTLLQQIARWIESTFPSAIVIWVSLADLEQGDNLKNYLKKQWLENLLHQAGGGDVSTGMKEIFGTHLQKGQVWLLLDGLDEMQGKNTLSKIQRQIQDDGWLQQMRIVMTCRLNLWDGNRNELETFDTYLTLKFAYPKQVEMFIEKWFAPRGVGSSEKGKKLCMVLKEPGNERIRDLMMNPLRLSLMCFSWFSKDGELPKTQAELYQRFVDRIYEWKQENFPTTPEHGNQTAIQALVGVMETTQDDDIRWIVAASLSKIDPGNQTAIQALVGVLKTTQDDDTRRIVAVSLGKIGSGNQTAIQALVGVLKTTQNNDTRWIVAASLREIDPGNETAIQVLVRSLRRNLRHEEGNILMMKCADLLSYRDFYRAFHDK